MAKDYAKRFYPPPKRRRSSSKWLAASAVAAIVISISAFVIYKIKHMNLRQSELTVFLSNIKSKMTKKTTDPVASTRQKTNAHSPEPGLHFSFYNELPNIRVTVPATEHTEKENKK